MMNERLEKARRMLDGYHFICKEIGEQLCTNQESIDEDFKTIENALDAVRWRDSRYELPEKRRPVLDECGQLVYLNDEGVWRYIDDDVTYNGIKVHVPSWMPIPEGDKSIPIKPNFDMWILCPTCGHDPDFKDVGGFEPDPDDPPFDHWVGPSFCPRCGQAFDLSELNENPLDTFAPENQTDL